VSPVQSGQAISYTTTQRRHVADIIQGVAQKHPTIKCNAQKLETQYLLGRAGELGEEMLYFCAAPCILSYCFKCLGRLPSFDRQCSNIKPTVSPRVCSAQTLNQFFPLVDRLNKFFGG